MMIISALAGLALSISAAADSPPVTKPTTVAMLCNRSSEQISGLTKICYYRCGKSEGAMTAATYEPCPRWTARWRLNRNAHFGPSPR